MAASATFALKSGKWFRRVRFVIFAPDSHAQPCALSGRDSTHRTDRNCGATSVRISAAVQRLQGSLANTESRSSTIGPITLEVKQTGEGSAGNPHAAFDVAGAGNRARAR